MKDFYENTACPFVRALAEAGADVKTANEYGVTPLSEAARVGNVEMCQVLLKAAKEPEMRAVLEAAE